MKRFLFVYFTACDYALWTDHSYTDHIVLEEATFPKGSSDWEINEDAKRHERQRVLLDYGTASECIYTRRLVRIVELAREVTISSDQ